MICMCNIAFPCELAYQENKLKYYRGGQGSVQSAHCVEMQTDIMMQFQKDFFGIAS